MQEEIISWFVSGVSWIAGCLFIGSICFEIYTRNALFFKNLSIIPLKLLKFIAKTIALIFDCTIRLITSPLTAFSYALGTILDIVYLLKDITRYQSIRKWITTGFYEYEIYDWEFQQYYHVKEKYQWRLKGIWDRYIMWLHNYKLINKNTPNYRMWFFWAYLCRLFWYFIYLGAYYIQAIVKYGLYKLCKAQMAELIFFSAYFIAHTLKVEIGWPLHKLVWTLYTFFKQQLYYITPNFLIVHLSLALNLRLFEWYTTLDMDEEFEHPDGAQMRDHYFALHWAKVRPIHSEFASNGLASYAIYFKCVWIHMLLVLIYIPIWALLLLIELVCKQLIIFTNLGILLYQYLLRKQYRIIMLVLTVENLTAGKIVSYLLNSITFVFKFIIIQLTRFTSNELLPYILLFPIVLAYYIIYYITNILLAIPGLLGISIMWLIRFIIHNRLFWLVLCALYWVDFRIIIEIGSLLSDNIQSILHSLNPGHFLSNYMLLTNARTELASNIMNIFYPWTSLRHRFHIFDRNLGFRNYPEDQIGLLSWYVDPEQWCDAWNWDNPPYHMRYEEFGEHPPRPDYFWKKDLYDDCYPFEACFHRYKKRSSRPWMLHLGYGRNLNYMLLPMGQSYGGALASTSEDWWYLNKYLSTLNSAQDLYRHLYTQHSRKWLRYGLYARNWRTRLFLFKQKPLAWFVLKIGGIRLMILNQIVLTYTFYWVLYASYNPFYKIALGLAIFQKIFIIAPYTFLQTVNFKFNKTFPAIAAFKSFALDSIRFCWANIITPGFVFCLTVLEFKNQSAGVGLLNLIFTYWINFVSLITIVINWYIISSWLQFLVSYFCIDEYVKLCLIQVKYYKWLISITINFPLPGFAQFWSILLKSVIIHDRLGIFIKIMYIQFNRCWEYIWCLFLTVFESFISRPEIILITRHTVPATIQYNDGSNYYHMIWNQINNMLRKYSYPVMGSPNYFHLFFNKYKLYAIGRDITINKALIPTLSKTTEESGDCWLHLNPLTNQFKSRYLNFYYYMLHNRHSNKYFIMYDQDNLSQFNYTLYNKILAMKNTKTLYFNSIKFTALYTLKLAFAPLIFATKTPSAFYEIRLPEKFDLNDIVTVEVSPYSKILLSTGILSPLLLPLIVIMKLQLVLDSLCVYLQIPRREQKYRQRFSIRNWLRIGRRLWIQPMRRTQLFTLRRWKPTNNDLVQNFLHFTTLKGLDHLVPHVNTCNDSLMLCNWEPGSVVSWMDDATVFTVETRRWWSLNYKLLYSLSISAIFWYFLTLILLGVCSNSFVYFICGDESQFKQRVLLSRQYNWDLYRSKGPAERPWLEFDRPDEKNTVFTKNVKFTNNIREKLTDYELNLQHSLKYNLQFKFTGTFLKMYKDSICKFSPNDEDEIYISPLLNQYHLGKRHEIYARNEHIGDRTYLQFIAYGYNKDYHINESWQQPDDEEYENILDDYRYDQEEVNYYMFKQDKKLYTNMFNLDKRLFNMQLPAWAWHKDGLNLRWYDIKDEYSPNKEFDYGMSGRYVIENDDDQGYIPFAFLCWFFVVPMLLVLKPYLFLCGFWLHYIKNPINISHHLQNYVSAIFEHLQIVHSVLEWSTVQHSAYKRAGSMAGRVGRRYYRLRQQSIYPRAFYHIGAGLLRNVMGTKWTLFIPQTIMFSCKEEIRLFYYFNICFFAIIFVYLARRNSKERKLLIRTLNSNLNTHLVSQVITAKAALKNVYLWFWR